MSFSARSLRWRNVCTAPSSVKILRRMLFFSQSSENGPVLRYSNNSKHRCRCASLFSFKALTSFDSLHWLNILDKFSLTYTIYFPPIYCFLACSSPAFGPLAFAAICSSSSFFKAAFRTFRCILMRSSTTQRLRYLFKKGNLAIAWYCQQIIRIQIVA